MTPTSADVLLVVLACILLPLAGVLVRTYADLRDDAVHGHGRPVRSADAPWHQYLVTLAPLTGDTVACATMIARDEVEAVEGLARMTFPDAERIAASDVPRRRVLVDHRGWPETVIYAYEALPLGGPTEKVPMAET